MWDELPKEQKEEYKRMILAFASLSEMFAQKAATADGGKIAPIVNSKYQETVFQKAFDGFAEDIGNTSYDVSVKNVAADGTEKKYLVGIKTFGIGSGDQKIAQFKQYNVEWADTFAKIQQNSIDEKGERREQEDINNINGPLYYDIAKKIAEIRNMRIDSSIANLQGFKVAESDDVESVYHVLMPSSKKESPSISVGETSYNHIDIDKLEVIGCTSAEHPTNFFFSDGKHQYKFTSADSQLLMKFNNSEIVKEVWDVKFVDDAYAVFSDISDKLYGLSEDARGVSHHKKANITESYSWKIVDKNGDLSKFSGLNSFYGVGSKIPTENRVTEISKFIKKYQNVVSESVLQYVEKNLNEFLLSKATSYNARMRKAELREKTFSMAQTAQNEIFYNDLKSKMYRVSKNGREVYLPIPAAKKFHADHPNFFAPNAGLLKEDGKNLALPKDKRVFNLVFEPSHKKMVTIITQQYGKGIESLDEQSIMGEWILGGIFQFKDYAPLNGERLKKVGINGIRLYKIEGSNDVHIEFLWIDDEDLPDDYWE